jgi:hypothetical protein
MADDRQHQTPNAFAFVRKVNPRCSRRLVLRTELTATKRLPPDQVERRRRTARELGLRPPNLHGGGGDAEPPGYSHGPRPAEDRVSEAGVAAWHWLRSKTHVGVSDRRAQGHGRPSAGWLPRGATRRCQDVRMGGPSEPPGDGRLRRQDRHPLGGRPTAPWSPPQTGRSRTSGRCSSGRSPSGGCPASALAQGSQDSARRWTSEKWTYIPR